METVEELLLRYRQTLRELLNKHGIPSNLGVTDDWILDKISELLRKEKYASQHSAKS